MQGAAAVLDSCLPGGTAFLAVWLIVSVAVGLVMGYLMSLNVDDDPARYRRRWGRPPLTAALLSTFCLTLALAALLVELAWPATICDERKGRSLILIVPWAVAAFAVVLPPMWRVTRRDRAGRR
jgi:hypothetical protein